MRRKISLSVFLSNAYTNSRTGAHTRTHLRNSISQINSCGQFLTKNNGTIRKSLSAPVTNLLPIIFQFITLNVQGFYKCSHTSIETPWKPVHAMLFKKKKNFKIIFHFFVGHIFIRGGFHLFSVYSEIFSNVVCGSWLTPPPAFLEVKPA